MGPRTPLQRTSSGVLGLLVASLLAGAAALAGPTATLAYNCPAGGSTSSQKDAWNSANSGYDLHGWLGYCQNFLNYQYYAGEDSRWTWGGSWHNVSSMSIHMRVWECGSILYDQTQTYYNAAYDQLVSPQYTYPPGCGAQADVSGSEAASGWNWSWYLHY